MRFIKDRRQLKVDQAGYYKVGYMIRNQGGEIIAADNFEDCIVVKNEQGTPYSLIFSIKMPKTWRDKMSAIAAILKG